MVLFRTSLQASLVGFSREPFSLWRTKYGTGLVRDLSDTIVFWLREVVLQVKTELLVRFGISFLEPKVMIRRTFGSTGTYD